MRFHVATESPFSPLSAHLPTTLHPLTSRNHAAAINKWKNALRGCGDDAFLQVWLSRCNLAPQISLTLHQQLIDISRICMM
jgi:hypothetical protein